MPVQLGRFHSQPLLSGGAQLIQTTLERQCIAEPGRDGDQRDGGGCA